MYVYAKLFYAVKLFEKLQPLLQVNHLTIPENAHEVYYLYS